MQSVVDHDEDLLRDVFQIRVAHAEMTQAAPYESRVLLENLAHARLFGSAHFGLAQSEKTHHPPRQPFIHEMSSSSSEL
jgi:hypothetical protein